MSIFPFILILILWTLKLIYPRYQIWQWHRRFRIKKHLTYLEKISQPINGFELSRLARCEKDACEYVYGEVDSRSWLALFSLTGPDKNTVFYDLGSGTGKTVLAAAMVFKIKKSCGIEWFENLHEAAHVQATYLKNDPTYQHCAEVITFIHGNFLDHKLLDATVIFVSATGLFGILWQTLNDQLAQLSQRPLIITTTKKLTSPAFKVLHQTRVQMSWGIVDAYIQQLFSGPTKGIESKAKIVFSEKI